MNIVIRAYNISDLPAMTELWNSVVLDGVAFPQTEPLSLAEAESFFGQQSYTAVAESGEEIVGLYILHPNNVGRCGHIGNASYAVKSGLRGQNIGEKLVRDSIAKCADFSFSILQFNAVVASNVAAIKLYKKIGFTELGTIPNGFKLDSGNYADIILFYIETM